MRFDGIIFDLDGTLWDSTRTVAESWTATIKRQGEKRIFNAEEIAGIMGCTGEQIEKKLFSCYGGRGHELCEKCMTEEPSYVAVHGGNIYPGVEDVLRKLNELCPLFIVSNCQSGYVEAFLAYSGYGKYFRDFEYLGRQGLSKRDNIRLIMERHGLGNTLYVGDTAHDEQSSKDAGCSFVHAGYGFGSAVSPLAVLHSPLELAEIIDYI